MNMMKECCGTKGFGISSVDYLEPRGHKTLKQHLMNVDATWHRHLYDIASTLPLFHTNKIAITRLPTLQSIVPTEGEVLHFYIMEFMIKA